ncbi:MAG: dihydrolipoyl dehydrogenase [Bacillota bacterium]
MQNHEITIIGGGPGGYVAAIKAAQLGKNVALIEKESIGGVCLNWGCIPTKALLNSAHVYKTFEHAKDFGFKLDMANVDIDFKAIMKRKNKIVKKLTGGVKYLLKKNGVTVYDGFGEVEDAHTIKVNDETIKTDKLIIATGASPAMPPIDGLKDAFDSGRVVASKQLLDIKEIPKTLTVIGGGVIGVEFATIFNALGTEVTIIERLDDILITVDQEIKDQFKKQLKKDGIKVITSANVDKITKDSVSYTLDDKEETIEQDLILLSVGMTPNLKGLEALDLETDRTGIITNEYMQTNIDDVYAIGDVNGKFQLAHVASKEGLVAVDHILGKDHKIDYRLVPSGIYTFPEIAQVGITEAQAKEQDLDYKTSTFPLSANGKALAENASVGMVKFIADKKYNEIIGVHILAPHATELISEAVLGMSLEATAEAFADAIHPHPTLSEMVHEVAHGIVDKPIHI